MGMRTTPSRCSTPARTIGHLYRSSWSAVLPFLLCAGAAAQTQLAPKPEATEASLVARVDPLVSSSLDNADPSTPSLPDAPQSQPDRAPSSKRILGIIPNFRTVSTDQRLPPQTVKQKFTTATQDSFDYSSIFIPAAIAGYSLGTTADPEFGGGGVGYGRYLWHAVVDQSSENYVVEAILPSVTHQDSRFYTLARGGVTRRAVYAVTRVVVTRSDSGKEVFNSSEVIGSGISAGLSSLYYPTRERSFGNTGKQWGLDIGIDAVSFAFKEFYPDLNQKLFGKKKDTP